MFRALPLIALLLGGMVGSALTQVQSHWKESGYISSCAGRGCLGRRTECAVYSFPTPDGGRNTFYCYQD